MEFLPGEWLGFPYAVRFAEEIGASRIHIQPRIADELIKGDIRPDVYCEMPSGHPTIIEIEYGLGAKFKEGGPRHRESALSDKATFVFIIGPKAKGGCEKKLGDYFGDKVKLVYLVDLVRRYGELGIGSVTISPLADSSAER
jgi:hypothetical protein